MELNCPTKALLVDYINQYEAQQSARRYPQQLREQTNESGLEKNDATHLPRCRAKKPQQPNLAPPVKN